MVVVYLGSGIGVAALTFGAALLLGMGLRPALAVGWGGGVLAVLVAALARARGRRDD